VRLAPPAGGRGLTIAVWLLLLAAGFVGLSLLAFWMAVRPPRLTVPLRPEDLNLRVEPVTIHTADRLRLAGWLVPRPGAPAVILLHGYPADKRDLLPLAAALHPRFTVLLVDQRYFGESEGRATTLGYRERDDLRSAVDLLHARGLTPVGVFGFSLGGSVALLAAADDPRIRAVVAYAPFADLRDLGQELYAYLWVLREPFVRLLRVWARLFLGADVTRPSPAEAAARLHIPVLLIHSRHDEQIPFRHAERLQQALAANGAARFAFVDRARHGELGRELERRLGDFFAEHLGPSPSPAPSR
jgi:dipeptidyl aminopeptidase/acylaminoacyl peptidase